MPPGTHVNVAIPGTDGFVESVSFAVTTLPWIFVTTNVFWAPSGPWYVRVVLIASGKKELSVQPA